MVGATVLLLTTRGDQTPYLNHSELTLSHFVFVRVRLVERGSPHSLPLMESGKVAQIHINPAENGKTYICLQN